DGTLAGAPLWLVRRVYQHGLYYRNGHAPLIYGVAYPVGGGDYVISKTPLHLFEQRTAHALKGAALHLIPDAVRIGNGTGILAGDEPRHSDRAGAQIHLDFRHQRTVPVIAFVEHTGDTAPGRYSSPRTGRVRRRARNPVG